MEAPFHMAKLINASVLLVYSYSSTVFLSLSLTYGTALLV